MSNPRFSYAAPFASARLWGVLASALALSVLAMPQQAQAQDYDDDDEAMEEIVVTGIRGSLASAIEEKRSADNLIEVIKAEDIGKLPDQNLAEVLENVTGIQITREGGVGTGVQIRGTNANRTEINGVSTVGSGAGRSGIDFEDVAAAIISAVEVTKAPEAKTIEGSVGGTINLRTIRPLELTQSLGSVRFQMEDSSLSTDGMQPRLSGAYGNNWSASSGDFGVVVSANYSTQDVSAFRPRTDRDNVITSDGGDASAQSFDFLPIQFLLQDYDNFEYETLNIASSFEWAPSENLTAYADLIINDQERRQESSRMQASGVSNLRRVAVPDAFETVNLGSLGGTNIGSIQGALRGVIPVDLDADDDDPNLRFSGDTNSRLTDNQVISFGADWQINNRLTAAFGYSASTSDSTTPNFNTTLNFINPNAPLDPGGANDNSTPIRYDLSGGTLQWGVAFGEEMAPTAEQLIDPANVVLRQVQQQRDKAENSETALVADFEFDMADVDWITTIDFGYRMSTTTSLRDQVRESVSLSKMADSPRGNLFASVLAQGPSNFAAADGRALAVRNFLTINPELAASSPGAVLAAINAAIVANNAITGSDRAPIDSPTSSANAFFDITETTDAFYAQMNYKTDRFRGSVGLRSVSTSIDSIGNRTVNDEVIPTTTSGSYSLLLPRLNFAADLRDDLVFRASWSQDIRRPDFDDLSTSFTFSTSENPAVNLGNPGLEPQEVSSLDLSVEYYFAPLSVVSFGYFDKSRQGLFVSQQEDPPIDANGYRDTTAPCEGGGIFNPIAVANTYSPDGATGVCVPTSRLINGSGDASQTGFELAVQYDLSYLEDLLGWVSGFGVIFNYTMQDFDPTEEVLKPTSRAASVFTALGAEDVTYQQPLIDLSETAYNLTLYYERYGVSARIRTTWREAYRSEDFGSTSSFPWGFPVVQGDREQVNASVSYAINDDWSVGVEIINLTEADVVQHCVNENALLCFQGLTDRRMITGGSYRF